MIKLAINSVQCRNMLHLIFELLCFYYLHQKRLVEIIFYFEIVTPNITSRKLKQFAKDGKGKDCERNIDIRMTDREEI